MLMLFGCGANYRYVPVQDRSFSNQSEAVIDEPALVGSTTSQPADQYEVVKGDTLYDIAVRYGINHFQLASWNVIEPPFVIYPGQLLGLNSVSGARIAAQEGRGQTSVSSSRSTIAQSVPPNTTDSRLVSPSTGRSTSPATATVSQPNVSASRPLSSTQPVEAPTVPVKPAIVAPKPNVPPKPATTTVSNTNTRSVRGVNWLWPVAGGSIKRGFVANENSRQGLDIGGSPGQPVLAAADGTVVYSGPGLTGYAELIIIKHNGELLSAYGHNRRRLVKEGEQVKSGQQIAELGRSPRGEDEIHFQVRRLGKPQNPMDYLPQR